VDRRALGWTGEKISPLILGSYEHGLRSLIDKERAIGLMRKAIELGINAFDTAESYGNGESEKVLGEAITQYSRGDLFIITKISPQHLRPEHLEKAVKASLSRLNLSYVDLVLAHAPNNYVPVVNMAKAMEDLVRKGLTRYVGVSNFPLPMLREFREHLSRTDVAANEMHYNLLFRDVEEEVLPYMVKENIPLLAYDPLGLGYLVGRREVRDEYRWYYLAKDKVVELLEPLVSEVREVSSKLSVTPAQLLLGWVMGKGAFPIFSTTNDLHLEEDVKARPIEVDLDSVSRQVWKELLQMGML